MACLGAERSGKGGCGGLPRQASNSQNPFIILVLSSLPEIRYTIVKIKIGLGGVSYTVSIRSFVVSSFFFFFLQVARADIHRQPRNPSQDYHDNEHPGGIYLYEFLD